MNDFGLDESLPKAAYVSPAEFEREREAIFHSDWFCVGREEEVPAAGDFLVADVAGESVLVVRTSTGTLAAHYNVCRHRGSRLVNGDRPCMLEGRLGPSGALGGAIRCPYHAWTYELDGRLRSAPFLTDLRRHRDELALHGVELSVWGGFVFVRLVPGAGGSLLDGLGGIPERLFRYPLTDLRAATRVVYEVEANWKVILENYNECYHCGPVHPELCRIVPAFRAGGGGLEWDDGIPHRPGAVTFTLDGTTTRAPFPGLSETERIRHKGELAFPNLMLSLSPDHVAALTLWPHGAAATTIVFDLLFHPDEMARDDFDPADALEFWDLVNRQDWEVCRGVQLGMGSRMFRVGYLAPMEEPSADVRRYVARRLE